MPVRLFLVSFLTVAPATARAEPAVEPTDTTETAVPAPEQRITTLVLQVDGMQPGVLRDAIGLRAPDLGVRSPDEEAFEPPTDPLFAYALVHPSADAASTWTVTVILSDGRAFFRTIEAEPQTSPRVVATSLVNLVRAAEAGTITADATRPLPDMGPTPPPSDRRPTDDPPPEDPPPPPPADPRVHIGVGLDGVLMTGFGPPKGADSLVAGAGGLTLAVRLRNGLTLTVSGRAASREREGLRMLRVRTSLGVGYTWRRDAFELISLAYAGVEPWWLVGEHPALSTRLPGDEFSRVLVGGGVRLGPGYFRALPRGHALHLGVRAEADGAAMTRGGWV